MRNFFAKVVRKMVCKNTEVRGGVWKTKRSFDCCNADWGGLIGTGLRSGRLRQGTADDVSALQRLATLPIPDEIDQDVLDRAAGAVGQAEERPHGVSPQETDEPFFVVPKAPFSAPHRFAPA